MSTIVNVGHNIALSIGYLDQNENPMLTPVTPDAPPTWSNTATTTETLVVAAGGLTAETTAVSSGTDVISLAVIVAGVTYPASLNVTVDAAPQVLTSVEIIPTVS